MHTGVKEGDALVDFPFCSEIDRRNQIIDRMEEAIEVLVIWPKHEDVIHIT